MITELLVGCGMLAVVVLYAIRTGYSVSGSVKSKSDLEARIDLEAPKRAHDVSHDSCADQTSERAPQEQSPSVRMSTHRELAKPEDP